MTQIIHKQEATQVKHVTLDEWLAAADVQPVEVVNGEIILMSPTKRKHNRISHGLFRLLDHHVIGGRLGEVWMETAYVLDGSKRENWVAYSRVPDISFITRERVDTHNALSQDEDGPWWLAPDLAVEIISPTDKFVEVMEKVAEYLRFGVRLVWLIEPKSRTIRVFTAEKPDGYTLHENDTLTGEPVLPGWSATVKAILDGQ